MNEKQLAKLFKYLSRNNRLIASSREDGVLKMREVGDVLEIELTNEIPLHSFKKFLLPQKEILDKKNSQSKMVLLGINILDLKAITILNHVFEKDSRYQDRIKNTLIIGYCEFPCEYKGMAAIRYEEDILEHIQFDLFIIKKSPSVPLYKGGGIDRYKILTGSGDGQRVLDEFGYKDYENIQYSGPIKEEGAEKRMFKIREALEKLSAKSKIFEELGKKCIECGRCSIICPLCFCFCLEDNVSSSASSGRTGRQANNFKKARKLTTCFYSEFSEVAGGHKFLKNPAERIFNWYEHKFIRFPEELSLMGCVGCGRCAKVCPMGINIKDVLEQIINGV